MSAAITASTWTPADWTALAGVVATAVGALATLGGVYLGARLAARDTRRRDAETALIAVGLAQRDLDVEDLSTEDLVDDSRAEDKSESRLQRIKEGDAVKLAHAAIIGLKARRNDPKVRIAADELDARLTSAHQAVAQWYMQQLAARKATGSEKDKAQEKAAQLLSSASTALDELRAKDDALRNLL